MNFIFNLLLFAAVNSFRFYGNVPQDSDVPIPTDQQVEYLEHEIAALIHFNMATFIKDGDPGCGRENWNQLAKGAAGISSDPATFNPKKLNVQQWVDNMKALGAKHAILTAKHGCGHLLWKSEVTLPDGREYVYAVGHSKSAVQYDLIGNFSETLRMNGIGHGFYYSLGNNFYLNLRGNKVGNKSRILPGQEYVTLDQYHSIVLAHVTELWTKYGGLFEIWLDHGYFDYGDEIKKLIHDNQLNTTGMNGFGVVNSPLCWVGTESGEPGSPDVWITGKNDGAGDPDSSDVCPRCSDTTLQQRDQWFWTGIPIYSLSHMIDVYHNTVGKSSTLELDFAIDRDGLVADDHSQRYHEFGNWIRSCYGKPLVSVNGTGTTFSISVNTQIDRFMIEEDIRYGQRIRSFDVKFTTSDHSGWQPWPSLTGKSVGHKRIEVSNSTRFVHDLYLTITSSKGTPVVRFSAYLPCATS